MTGSLGNTPHIEHIGGQLVEDTFVADLVVLSVAVGILGNESFQNLIQLIGGGRSLQTQIVQPSLIDEELTAAVGTIVSDGADAVHMAVALNQAHPRSGVRLQTALINGHILINQIVNRNDDALIHTINLGIDGLGGAGVHNNIGIITGGKHQVHLCGPVRLVNLCVIDMDVGILFQFFSIPKTVHLGREGNSRRISHMRRFKEAYDETYHHKSLQHRSQTS